MKGYPITSFGPGFECFLIFDDAEELKRLLREDESGRREREVGKPEVRFWRSSDVHNAIRKVLSLNDEADRCLSVQSCSPARPSLSCSRACQPRWKQPASQSTAETNSA